MEELEQLATETLAACRSKGWLVATAESCTGGLVSGALTEIAGSSDVVDCGFTTYSNEAKQSMLGVKAETLQAVGAVSEDVAREMALGAVARSRADIAISTTGVAGPGGSDHKPEGRVCFGLATPDGSVRTITREFGSIGRAKVRMESVRYALELLKDAAT